jgi:putative restriction endonuclease
MDTPIRYFVGLTDAKWFNFLRSQTLTEVNFWRPGIAPFRALPEYGPFLFRLHAPDHFIVGGGFFVRYLRLPLPKAWEIFEQGNGAPDYNSLIDLIGHHRDPGTSVEHDIGCIVLSSPFFFDEKDWLPVPKEWDRIFGPGQSYSTEDRTARKLWEDLQARLLIRDARMQQKNPAVRLIAEPLRRYGAEHLVKSRLGQPGFRAVVTDAYQQRCAISGEKTLPVLEAAHIRPYADNGPHSLANGLLLRADLHILFDQGYITVTKDLQVKVSPKIKEEYENGHEYYAFNKAPLIQLPTLLKERPDPTFLEWHDKNRFRS